LLITNQMGVFIVSKRITMHDLEQEERFYKLDKALIWSKKYREGTDSNAKLAYGLIRDRFMLSVKKNTSAVSEGATPVYVNDKGEIYCILDNVELAFSLNISKTVASKAIQQLKDVDLISYDEECKDKKDKKGNLVLDEDGNVVRVPVGGAKHIYLNHPETDDASFVDFIAQRDYHKHVLSRKKKGLEPSYDFEHYLKLAQSKYSYKLSQPKKADPAPKKEGYKNETPGGIDYQPPGDADIPPLGVQDFDPNNTDINQTDVNETDPNQIDLIEELRSSKDSEEIPNIVIQEEEINNHNILKGNKSHSSSKNNVVSMRRNAMTMDQKKQIRAVFHSDYMNQSIISYTDNYALLDTILDYMDVFMMQKDRNVIKKALNTARAYGFTVTVLKYAFLQHEINLAKLFEKTGKVPQYEPAFFANNLVDRFIESQKQEQLEAMTKAIKKHEEKRQQQIGNVSFYNWLEN